MTEPRPDLPQEEGGEPATAGSSPDPAAGPETEDGAETEAQREAETMAEGVEIEAELATLEVQLEERTQDLQRVQAEFLNYKRRVDRDRELIRENATYVVLERIVEVLDTIDRAREHDELDGGFKAVADQLERVVAGLGLVKFGAVGDAFDPAIHDALSHVGQDPDVAVTTCKVVAKAGYRIGDRVVRPAQVLVVDPVDGPTEDSGGGTVETPPQE